MTNLQLPIDNLKPIEELLQKVNYDEGRVIIDQKIFKDDGLVMYLRDRYRTETTRVLISKSDVVDMIDEYKNLDGKEYEWLRLKATNVQRERIINRMLDILFFKATDLQIA